MLKSLTVVERRSGRAVSVSMPLDPQTWANAALATLRPGQGSLAQVLDSLRGSLVTLKTRGDNVHGRVAMVEQMEKEGFGACSNEGECQAVCPKEISVTNIQVLSREYARAVLKALIESGIFVRMPGVAPLDRCIRISAGTDADLAVLEELLPRALAAARK